MPARFKRAEHGDDKGVLGKSEDVSLHERLLDLVPQDQVLAVYLLHGKPLTGLLVADQIHGTGNREADNHGFDLHYVFKKPLWHDKW